MTDHPRVIPEDDFDVPVFSWAQRFYLSLFAKYCLYFDQSLRVYEQDESALLNVRNGEGISYLACIRDFLQRITQKASGESQIGVMLVFHVQSENKVPPLYHPEGYFCPEQPLSVSMQQNNHEGAYGHRRGPEAWSAVLVEPKSFSHQRHWPIIVNLLESGAFDPASRCVMTCCMTES